MKKAKNKQIQKRLAAIYKILLKKYGEPKPFLNYKTPFQLLVMAILSAQCKDAKVNAASPAIFAKYPDPEAMSDANFAELSELIKPLGLYRTKTKNLIAMSKILVEKYSSRIPDNISDLVKLPGVGRKTANVVIGHVFGKPGFPVDTHVQRIIRRLGLAGEKDSPEKIEKIVNSNIPAEYWTNFSLLLISHGRTTCKPKPGCGICEIRKHCETGKSQSVM